MNRKTKLALKLMKLNPDEFELIEDDKFGVVLITKYILDVACKLSDEGFKPRVGMFGHIALEKKWLSIFLKP